MRGNTMKIYRFLGYESAIDLLRPNAKYEADGKQFLIWDDPRPMPSHEEIRETLDKIQIFEDSINTIWLPEQLESFKKFMVINNLLCVDSYHKFRNTDINALDDLINKFKNGA